MEWSFTASNALKPYITLTNGKLTVLGTTKIIQGSVTINIVPALAKSVKIYDNGKAVTSATLTVGNSRYYNAVVLPTDAAQTVTWTSSAPDIAAVDQNGLVTPRHKGTAIITATTADGTKTAKLKITVR